VDILCGGINSHTPAPESDDDWWLVLMHHFTNFRAKVPQCGQWGNPIPRPEFRGKENCVVTWDPNLAHLLFLGHWVHAMHYFFWVRRVGGAAGGKGGYTLIHACHTSSTNLVLHATQYSNIQHMLRGGRSSFTLLPAWARGFIVPTHCPPLITGNMHFFVRIVHQL